MARVDAVCHGTRESGVGVSGEVMTAVLLYHARQALGTGFVVRVRTPRYNQIRPFHPSRGDPDDTAARRRDALERTPERACPAPEGDRGALSAPDRLAADRSRLVGGGARSSPDA